MTETDIEKQIADNAVNAQRVDTDGTSTIEHSLPDQVVADKYTRANRSMRRPGCGITFRKIQAPGGV